MRRIFFVTHAESVHHAEGLTGGWYDTGLTKTGRLQAEMIADRLLERIEGKGVAVYSSDLLRTAETAQVIAQSFRLEPVLLTGLRELRHGDAEGRPRAWLHTHGNPFPPKGDFLDYRICMGAESRRECAQRIYAAMDQILLTDQENLIIISHSFVLTYLVLAVLGVPIAALSNCQLLADPAGLTLLREDSHGSRTLVYLNCTAHLHNSFEQVEK